jgi:hypothetical protein
LPNPALIAQRSNPSIQREKRKQSTNSSIDLVMTIAEEQKYELSKAVEVIKDRLFFASVNGTLCDTPNHHCFCTDATLCYEPFFSDFGPLNLSCLYRFCQDLIERLKEHEAKAVVYYCGTKAQSRANSAAMIGAYQIIYMDKTPAEAYSCLRRMGALIERGGGGLRESLL